MAEINVVPYIDVMLVLLVIFMITAPMLARGVDVNLPQAAAQTLSKNELEPIVVSVDANGYYYLNIASDPNRPITRERLYARVMDELAEAKRSGQKRPLLVRGDEKVNYGTVVEAMVLLKEAGAESVGLVTEMPQRR